MFRVAGDDMEHEQDTVLQLQEVIEQLRNVFPSEPGQLTCTPSGEAAALGRPHKNQGQRGVQKGTAAGR